MRGSNATLQLFGMASYIVPRFGETAFDVFLNGCCTILQMSPKTNSLCRSRLRAGKSDGTAAEFKESNARP
jgi:hypothetical protein